MVGLIRLRNSLSMRTLVVSSKNSGSLYPREIRYQQTYVVFSAFLSILQKFLYLKVFMDKLITTTSKRTQFRVLPLMDSNNSLFGTMLALSSRYAATKLSLYPITLTNLMSKDPIPVCSNLTKLLPPSQFSNSLAM